MSWNSLQHSLLIAILFWWSGAKADVIHLANNSVIHGRVVSLTDSTLNVETAFAGTLTIDRSTIDGLSTDEPVALRLPDNIRHEGRLVYRAEEEDQQLVTTSGKALVITPTELARLRIVSDAPLATMAESAPPRPAGATQAATPAETTHSDGSTDTDAAPSTTWSLSNECGMSGSNGNTDRVSFNGKTVARRTTVDSRLDLSLNARFAREDGAETENEIISRNRYERDFSERWFVFSSVELERDEFEDLDLRSVLTLGTGVFVIKTQTQELKLRGGAGYQRQDFMSAPTEDEGIASLGFDYMIALNSWLKFTHQFTLLPLMNDPLEDFRIESDAGLDIPVSNDKAWRIRLGLRNHFNNQPVAGNEELDTFYTVSLAYDIQ